MDTYIVYCLMYMFCVKLIDRHSIKVGIIYLVNYLFHVRWKFKEKVEIIYMIWIMIFIPELTDYSHLKGVLVMMI